ncbi:MAG: GNAT family N-acetyltransferase [Chitinophagaceae bacterium]
MQDDVFMVETDRLKLIPLSYLQLKKYLKADSLLEDELGLNNTGRVVAEEVKDMVEFFTLPRMKQAKGNDYLFRTFWIAVEKKQLIIVAELGFKGEPDVNSEIEIGYGTMPDQQGKGYMTEAVSGLIRWAEQREDVHGILAETDKHNLASIRIVQKNGFEQFDQKKEMLWWRKTTRSCKM